MSKTKVVTVGMVIEFATDEDLPDEAYICALELAQEDMAEPIAQFGDGRWGDPDTFDEPILRGPYDWRAGGYVSRVADL